MAVFSFLDDKNIIGSKAYNLGLMNKMGLNVPNGLVLPALSLFHSNKKREIKKEILEEIFRSLTTPLLVRSSATLEDGIVASFAGQFTSVGSVGSLSQLSEAISRIDNGVTLSDLETYLKHYNLKKEDIELALIVQEYKRPLLSGVFFSDAQGDNGLLRFEYSNKEGGVVGGTDTPLVLVFDREKDIFIEGAPTKKLLDVILPSCLKAIRVIEADLGYAWDIEWLFDGKTVWLVQLRPVTANIVEEKKIVENELIRLSKIYGPDSPELTDDHLAEMVQSITPVTLSLLRRIYDTDGSLGRALGRYYPLKKIETTVYLVDAFGKIFLNRNAVDEVLLGRLPYRSSVHAGGLLAHSSSVRFYFPGFVAFIRMLPATFKYFIDTLRLKLDVYRGQKIFGRKLSSLEQTVLPTCGANLDLLAKWVERIVMDTTPQVLHLALYQQHVLAYLNNKLAGKLSEDELQIVLTTHTYDGLFKLIHSNVDQAKIMQTIGHRGPNEIELSSPRYGEEEELFEKYIGGIKDSRLSPDELEQRSVKVREERAKIISRFLSRWDQQMLHTYFSLYDTYSAYRERMHDLWVRDLTFLREILLSLDHSAKLYNGIWYAKLEEIFEQYPDLDARSLFQERQKRKVLEKIAIKKNTADLWRNIIIRLPAGESITDGTEFHGSGISHGRAQGKPGRKEDLDRGALVDILVMSHLDPSVVSYFGKIKGIVSEVGGTLSHTAIVAREFGVPVVKLDNALSSLKKVSQVEINGHTGLIKVLK